jgi:plastocyanin
MQQHLRTPELRIGLIPVTIALLSGLLLMAPVFARADTSVSMIDDSFSPQTTTIAPGDTVTWTNNGSMNHTVTADDGSFSSGTILPGNSFTHTFSTVGNFPYYCQFHGASGGVGMSGVVMVSSSASSTGSSTSTSATGTGTSTTATSTNSTTSTSTTATSTNATSTGTTTGTGTTTSATSTPGTTTAPVLSNGSVTPNNTGAMINWTTNVNSDARVAYGVTTAYTTTTSSDNASSTSHAVFIGGLLPGTLYHFQAMSSANGLSGMSPDETFTTTNGSSTNTGTSTATSTPSTGGTGTSTATSTPGNTGTTTPVIDISGLSRQIAQLEIDIKSLEMQIQALLQGGGVTSPGMPTSEGTAVYADSYSVLPGGAITFRGNGFGANETVNISADGTVIGHVNSSSSGTFTTSGTASNETGDTTYRFTGATSGRSDSVMITVETGNE